MSKRARRDIRDRAEYWQTLRAKKKKTEQQHQKEDKEKASLISELRKEIRKLKKRIAVLEEENRLIADAREYYIRNAERKKRQIQRMKKINVIDRQVLEQIQREEREDDDCTQTAVYSTSMCRSPSHFENTEAMDTETIHEESVDRFNNPTPPLVLSTDNCPSTPWLCLSPICMSSLSTITPQSIIFPIS